MQRLGDLGIDQDLGFERRQWVVQRGGWTLMVVVIVAAVLGLFGSGPLSSAEVTSADGTLRVEYERFVRREVQHELSVTVAVNAQASGEVELWVDVASLDTMVVDTISPQPTEERIEGERQVFVFAVGDAEQLSVRFDVAREDMGRNRVSLGIVGGSETSYTQVSYP